MEGPLEVIADERGAVVVGWLSSYALYARFSGRLSAELGQAYADRLERLVQPASALCYFADARLVRQYDLVARSAFVRVVLAHRLKFASIVILTWTEGIGAAARSLLASLGAAGEILTDPAEFAERLADFAPFAQEKLDPKSWIHVRA